MLWSKFKRHFIVFATLMVATRLFLLPGWAPEWRQHQQDTTASVQQKIHQFLEFSGDNVPDVVIQLKIKNELPKSNDFDLGGASTYRGSDLAKVSYAGGLLGSGRHLRAPPLPLWLLNRSLLL